MSRGCLNRKKNCRQIRLQNIVESLERRLSNRCNAADSCIREHDIQLAETFDPLRDRTLDGLGIRDIGFNRQNVRADLLCRSIERRRIPAGDDHLGALADEQPRRGEPDPTVTARDQRGLVLESHVRNPPTSLSRSHRPEH